MPCIVFLFNLLHYSHDAGIPRVQLLREVVIFCRGAQQVQTRLLEQVLATTVVYSEAEVLLTALRKVPSACLRL